MRLDSNDDVMFSSRVFSFVVNLPSHSVFLFNACYVCSDLLSLLETSVSLRMEFVPANGCCVR